MDTGRRDWYNGERVAIHALDVDVNMSDKTLADFMRTILTVDAKITDHYQYPAKGDKRIGDTVTTFRIHIAEPQIEEFRFLCEGFYIQVYDAKRVVVDDVPTERRGDWMQLYSGKQFWPFDPRVGDFDIRDIAHGLSNLCRYAGHTRFFYSVAEHSWLLSFAVHPSLAMEALLHDGSEAYVADIPKPIKRELKDYCFVENTIQSVLAEQFGLQYPFSDAIHTADRAILANEAHDCLSKCEVNWTEGMSRLSIYGTDTPFHIAGILPYTMEQLYLNRYYELGGV